MSTWLTLYSLSLDFLVDNACDHHRPRHWSYHLLSYYQQPIVPRHLSKNLEQFDIRSDIIKVSLIIQD